MRQRPKPTYERMVQYALACVRLGFRNDVSAMLQSFPGLDAEDDSAAILRAFHDARLAYEREHTTEGC